jgi:hypothetical protein
MSPTVLTAPAQTTAWHLSPALELIRAIQQSCRAYGYHVALGGGVLNKGESEKDVDLYFLPMDDQTNAHSEMLNWLCTFFGDDNPKPIGAGYPSAWYRSRYSLRFGTRRIDVFIV